MRYGPGHGTRAVLDLSEVIMRSTIDLVGDATLPRLSRRAALRRYHRAGYAIGGIEEIRGLSVTVPDRLSRGVVSRWTVLVGASGVVTGAGGIASLVADIPILLSGNLAAIGEIACVYGFDVAAEDEQAYAIALLFAERDRRATGAGTLARLRQLARELESGASWREVRDESLTPWLRSAARRLAWQLVKRRLAGIVPGVGALVAGGVNAQFTRHTCLNAREIYHRRFMEEFVD